MRDSGNISRRYKREDIMKLGALKTIKIENMNGHWLGSYLIENDIYGMAEDYMNAGIWFIIWWRCGCEIAGQVI